MAARMISRLSWAAACVVAAMCVIAAGVFHNNIFRWTMDPRAPFQTTTPPAPPDYDDPQAWAERPAGLNEAGPPHTAVFFVHPTGYWGRGGWNAAVDHAVARERLEQVALPNFARPFESVGAIWAPRYRQAALYAFLTHRYDARRARALAFADVARAFDAFLASVPDEAPFILVGVEQGGLHVLGLLQDRLRAESVRDRLVAAYVIDHATPLDLFAGPLAHLQACETGSDVRCVVSWGAVEADDRREIDRFRERSMVWTESGRLRPTSGRALLCVNPVTGAANEDLTPARLNRGGVDATGLEPHVAPAPLPAQTSAQCMEGVLLVDQPASRSLRRKLSWGVRYKPRQANLFYADIERDARARAAAYAELAAIEARQAPPLDGVITLRESPINPVPTPGEDAP